MDENKNVNQSNTNGISKENEAILQKKKAGEVPAYATRRQTPRVPDKDQATVVRRPAPQRPTQPQSPQPRPAAPRPAQQGAPARRVPENCPMRGSPPQQAPSRPAVRPAPAPVAKPAETAVEKKAEEIAVKPAPAAPNPPQKAEPAYMQRRQAPKAEDESAKGTVVAPTPKAAEPKDVKAAPVKEKESAFTKKKTDKKNDKQTNAKAGADMMVGIVKAMAYMVVILVVSVFISVNVISIGNDVFAFVKSDEAIDVTIPENADIGDIADVLSDNGIIKYPGIFKMYAGIKKDSGEFIAGDYTVSPSMSYDDLRRAFKKQAVTGTVWITIPEGYSVDEIIDLMVENGIGEREKYIDVINNYDFDYWFIDELEASQIKDGRVYRLEGYLFPDTYEFYKASSEEMVVNKLLARFDEVFVDDYRTKAKELGYTVDQILTIASLVEKEAGNMSDFMYVSSVFHNRLNNPATYPRLESDATTVYAIQVATGVRPDKVTPEDNKFEHPYNTYLNEGLMPGPITNPSASAIRYALYPAKSTYYYFITDNNGKVYYASGIAEHTKNIELVKQINAKED